MTADMVAGFDDVDREWLRSRRSIKWHRPGPGVLPAWVADMDFRIPPVVADALREAVDRADLGYPDWTDGTPLRAQFAGRMAERYGWEAPADRVREQTDIVQCVQLILHLATSEGGAVAVQTPAYPPFLATLRAMGRPAVPLPMTDTGEGPRLDMAAVERSVARHRCKVLLLVNPHNPTGRVLTREELTDLAEVARRHDLLVLSDEIHAELAHAPHRHVPFASLSPDTARRTVTLTSATKAFNLAAVRCTVSHYGPDRLLALRDAAPSDLYGVVSPLGVLATRAAWRDGDAWQRDLATVLDRNRRRVRQVLRERLPAVGHHMPEGTYLAWLDARALGFADPVERVLRRGRVLLAGGSDFGPDAGPCLRLNFATSRDILEDVLDGVVHGLS